MTYMFILKCALKLVLKNILYYDARSEKQKKCAIVVLHGNDKQFVCLIQYVSNPCHDLLCQQLLTVGSQVPLPIGLTP